MSTGNPDLFVICKSCGSEVSPYITECPYCGNRLRKRAPKLDRQGRITERRLRKPPAPALSRLRRGEIPGIRPESRPYATMALVAASVVGCLLWRTGVVDQRQLIVFGKPGHEWWRLFTAPFIYANIGYAFAAIGAIAIFGWLLERRHGLIPVVALFAVGGVGGTAATAAAFSNPIVMGGNGAALALLCAWAIPDLLTLRRKEDIDGDILGAAAIGIAVALMPLVAVGASWISDAVGVVAGLAIGLPLALTQEV
jgi:membrane associated rhomboid family serine protease